VDHLGPDRAQQSYRHEAFLWHEPADFTAGLVPFLEDGLDAGEPIMVAVGPVHTTWLKDALGDRAADVTFVDMHRLGRNPARIIPAWQEFLDAHADTVVPARGIGEPIWPGRREVEVEECQLHEALLNVAVDPSIPFWLICPYEADVLPPAVVEEAYRSHPVIIESASYQGSTQYAGRAHVDALLSKELAEPGRSVRPAHFSRRDVGRLFTYVKLELYVSGLSESEANAMAGVVQRLAESSLHRGSSGGLVRIWTEPGAVLCEVADDTTVSDPLVGRRPPRHEDHDAVWLANQVCPLVQVRSTDAGTAVRLHHWR
jgi:hypothetical protein